MLIQRCSIFGVYLKKIKLSTLFLRHRKLIVTSTWKSWTHLSPILRFYTPWKYYKTNIFVIFRDYSYGKLDWSESTKWLICYFERVIIYLNVSLIKTVLVSLIAVMIYLVLILFLIVLLIIVCFIAIFALPIFLLHFVVRRQCRNIFSNLATGYTRSTWHTVG